MKKVIRGLKILLISILVLILIVNIFIMIQVKSNSNKVPSVFGYKSFIVLSGSMESKINIGDLVIVKQTNIDNIKTNDIIAFRDNENLVTTHRIIDEININGKKCFKTKGDSNNTEDQGVVCEKQIEGKYQWKVAKIGSFIMFIQTPLGFMIMMLTILIICILIYFISSKKTEKMTDEELKEFEEFKKLKKEEEQQEKND